MNTTTYLCVACTGNCATCKSDKLEYCYTCISGTFLTATNTCTSCTNNALLCATEKTAASCKAGYYLKTDGTCADCPANSTCTSDTAYTCKT